MPAFFRGIVFLLNSPVHVIAGGVNTLQGAITVLHCDAITSGKAARRSTNRATVSSELSDVKTNDGSSCKNDARSSSEADNRSFNETDVGLSSKADDDGTSSKSDDGSASKSDDGSADDGSSSKTDDGASIKTESSSKSDDGSSSKTDDGAFSYYDTVCIFIALVYNKVIPHLQNLLLVFIVVSLMQFFIVLCSLTKHGIMMNMAIISL